MISAIDRTDFITWTICIRSNTFSRVNESSSTSARIVPNCSRVSRLNRFDHRSFFPGMFGRVSSQKASEKFGDESERLALLLRIRSSMKYLFYLYLTESRDESCCYVTWNLKDSF